MLLLPCHMWIVYAACTQIKKINHKREHDYNINIDFSIPLFIQIEYAHPFSRYYSHWNKRNDETAYLYLDVTQFDGLTIGINCSTHSKCICCR